MLVPEKVNHRIVVTPTEDNLDDCTALMVEIARHCDQQNMNHVCDLVCPFCEYTWDSDNEGPPDCCEEANRAWAQDIDAVKEGDGLVSELLDIARTANGLPTEAVDD